MSSALPGFLQGAKNAPGGTLGSILTLGNTNLLSGIAGAIGGVTNDLSSTPDLKTPTTPAANPATASTTTLQTTLAKEQNARSTATILTSPAGLHDEPTTTSSLLTGA